MRLPRLLCRALFGAATALALLATAQASDFPSRQVTILSPFAAGGDADTLACAIAEKPPEIRKYGITIN